MAALAWFSRPTEADEEQQQGAGGAAAEDAADEAEAEIIQLLKRAKLSIMKDEPEEAELLLHDALRLAYQSDNKKAITYTYDLAEQLFKATMSYLLGGGMKQEDNAIIEISLKLASIYAAQNRQEFALAGYEFCISTLEEKIEREKELPEDIVSGQCTDVDLAKISGDLRSRYEVMAEQIQKDAQVSFTSQTEEGSSSSALLSFLVEEKANTHLLLGMCLDSCARYLLFSKQPSQAQRMYEKALQISEEIQGERHPQCLLHSCSALLSFLVEEKANTHLLLGMCLDSCARYLLFSKQPSQAQRMYEKALQISEEIQGERHPQTIVLMSDLATTLDAQGRYEEAHVYMQRASDLARQINHPELHMVLSNLAAVLMHRERYTQAKEIYQEALKQAELRGDEVSIQHIREELLSCRKKVDL
ncbi:Tetratricopeptide repeat protein 19, mitochondrial [Tupaia chinensis]|uniref:Tetratricopeptide repeat protein 19, mitochondrial n=1 Tax=Tupaia chinensis TaxID=246437 RepID=L9KIM1_TUPCH|nr:Tetratricopeptide repeat protein 19, mitochondrial [Tupaia chinensis]